MKRNNLAVMFVGRIKGYKEIEDQLQYIKDTYNATFFVSLNKQTSSPYITSFCNKYSIGPDQIILKQSKSPEWIRSFDVAYEVKGGKESETVNHMYSSMHNLHTAFDLILPFQEKHNIKFDCILYYRADINAETPIQINMPLTNTIYIPEGYDWHGVNNQVSYGDYDSMSKYVMLDNNLQKLCGGRKVIFHPETLLKRHLEDENMQIVRFPFKYKLLASRHERLPEYDDYP